MDVTNSNINNNDINVKTNFDNILDLNKIKKTNIITATGKELSLNDKLNSTSNKVTNMFTKKENNKFISNLMLIKHWELLDKV